MTRFSLNEYLSKIRLFNRLTCFSDTRDQCWYHGSSHVFDHTAVSTATASSQVRILTTATLSAHRLRRSRPLYSSWLDDERPFTERHTHQWAATPHRMRETTLAASSASGVVALHRSNIWLRPFVTKSAAVTF